MSKFAIICVGYNRVDSIQNLLESVTNANYDNNDIVDLIISLDYSSKQEEIINIVNKLCWLHGKKIIRAFNKRQGLRKHIIQCGDLSYDYDAVIVLEDDLIVSKYFYSYIKETLDAYKNNNKIAGISLYKHEIHPGVYRPFEPVNNGYDIFFMQFAMSWGQCWTKQMWQKFKIWYIDNEGADLSQGNILPSYIEKWNEQSWLKYYMRYIVENDLYFVYPYISLATNNSDVGEHCVIPNNDYQVSLLQGVKKYHLPEFEDAVKYDVFFERLGINDMICVDKDGAKLLDLYGCRSTYGRACYLISTRALPFKIVDSFALKFRPIEMNCLMGIKGDGIRVYNLLEKSEVQFIDNEILTRYEARAIHWKRLLKLGLRGLVGALKSRLKFRKWL